MTPGLLLLTLTLGFPLGSHPCKPFTLVVSPRLGLRQVRPQVQALFARCGGIVHVALDDAQASNSLPNFLNDKSLGSFDDSFVTNPQANGTNCLPLLGA